MSLQTLSIINKATQKKDKYNILTFDTHERYQTQLCKTGHDFYAFRYEGCKEWNETFAPKPSNYFTLPSNSIIGGINFDFILSQSKFGQFQTAYQINNMLKLPMVSLEHTLPISNWPPEQVQSFNSMRGNINVYISEYSTKQWDCQKNDEVIHHSVDTELFCPSDIEKSPAVLSVVNDFVNRDYCCNYQGWKRITENMKTRLVGDTDGLSKPAKSVQDLVQEYQKAQVFLNTSTISPVPTSLLEAMSCGCPVVSTATCMIPEIIEHGVNGFISNDEQELKKYINDLLEDEELRNKIGAAARQTVLENFSEEKFINRWNTIFDKAYGE